MLVVCGAVMFFGMVGRLFIDLLPLEGVLYALSSGMVEFVNGTVRTAGLDIEMGQKLIMTAFIVGFGGLSVHAQVIAVIARYGFSLVPYFAGMLMHGLIAALYTAVYLHFFPVTEAVFAPAMGRAFCASASCLAAAGAAAAVIGGGTLMIRTKMIQRGIKE